MNEQQNGDRRRAAYRLLAGATIGTFAVGVANTPASAATVATFASGVLTVVGDDADNTIVISRTAAGVILVNNGAIAVVGGSPTVANTTRIVALGGAGNDALSLNEANGALPAANLFGGVGNDLLTGGSGGDLVVGQAGNDTLLGRRRHRPARRWQRERHDHGWRRRRPGLRPDRGRPDGVEPR